MALPEVATPLLKRNQFGGAVEKGSQVKKGQKRTGRETERERERNEKKQKRMIRAERGTGEINEEKKNVAQGRDQQPHAN